MKRWVACLLLSMAFGLGAQTPADGPSTRMAAERGQLQAERKRIELDYEAQQRECWQRFAVNSCLTEARRSRRTALAPVRARELALNAEERAWRTRQRDLRLQDKAEGQL